jgi:hypothetical protein
MPIMTTIGSRRLPAPPLSPGDPRRTRELRSVVPNASSILLGNVYGWFARIERGVYGLTPKVPPHWRAGTNR